MRAGAEQGEARWELGAVDCEALAYVESRTVGAGRGCGVSTVRVGVGARWGLGGEGVARIGRVFEDHCRVDFALIESSQGKSCSKSRVSELGGGFVSL